LKHIKTTGTTRFSGGLWSKKRLEDFEMKYAQTFSDKNGAALSYHPIYCIAKRKT
jgi:hypothetical protein